MAHGLYRPPLYILGQRSALLFQPFPRVLSHITTVGISSRLPPPPQLPDNNQVCLTNYKRGCLPPPHSLALLLCPLAPMPTLSPLPSLLSLHMLRARLYSSSLCLCLSLSLMLGQPWRNFASGYSLEIKEWFWPLG